MPDSSPEQKVEPPVQAREVAPAKAPPEPKSPLARRAAGHGGAYTEFRGLLATSDGQEPPPERFTPIFRSAEIASPVNETQKARVLGALQQQFGNRYVQRVMDPAGATPAPAAPGAPIQRQAAAGDGAAASSALPAIAQSSGQPLDQATRAGMGARFGHDFSGVRAHTDGSAHQAAQSLGAEAFTSGRDIYFSRGAYDPGSERGRGLLAHELTHVVQQERGMAGAGAQGFRVSQPGDPLERQAEAVSAALLRGELLPPISAAAPGVWRQAARAGGAAPPAAPAAPAAGARPAAARPGDYPITVAGATLNLPIGALIERAAPGGKVPVPVGRLPSFSAFKVTNASVDLDDSKLPSGATVNVELKIPPVTGQGSLTVDKQGNATGSVHAAFRSNKIPGLKDVEVDARVGRDSFGFEATVPFDLPKVSGNLNYKYQDGKHSGKGKAAYEGAKLKGSLEIIMSEAGRISGSGTLAMELFKGLRGDIAAEIDERRNIKVRGKLTVPGQIELFPEKKYEKSFFNFEKKFPIWGITIPVIDVNVGIFAEIHAGAGFRAKFGPGVLRDIALTGEFGSDPEAATEFGLGGEFFLPAGAEVVANIGGGIGLGLAVADITGGIEAVGVAGLYAALTVRPQFKYAGGKYTISGMAELAGVGQLKFGINAFAKIDVGVWIFKGTVWRKDWKLAEWVWNLGLNLALRANVNYTLGEDFAPDFSFETGQVDPEKFIKDAMPESGSPVPAPPKPPVPDKSSFTAEGTQGGAAASAPAQAPAPPAPGTPPAKTQAGTAPPTAGKAPGAPGGAAPGASEPAMALPGGKIQHPLSMLSEGHTLTAEVKGKSIQITLASGQQRRLYALAEAVRTELSQRRQNVATRYAIVDLSEIEKKADENAINQDYTVAGGRDPRSGTPVDFPRFMQIRLAQIATELVEFAHKHKATSIEAILTQVPEERFLPVAFRGGKWIRPNLYLFGKWTTFRNRIVAAERSNIYNEVRDARQNRDQAKWNDLLRGHRGHRIPEDATMHPSDPNKDSFTEAGVLSLDYDLDHETAIAKHWNRSGLNSDDAAREKQAYESKLRVITSHYNRSIGSAGDEGEDKEYYEHYVKKNFTSDLAENNKEGAKTIAGQSFVDGQDQPIP